MTTSTETLHPGHKLLREVCPNTALRRAFVVDGCRMVGILQDEMMGPLVSRLDWAELEAFLGVAIETYERELIADFIQSI